MSRRGMQANKEKKKKKEKKTGREDCLMQL